MLTPRLLLVAVLMATAFVGVSMSAEATHACTTDLPCTHPGEPVCTQDGRCVSPPDLCRKPLYACWA